MSVAGVSLVIPPMQEQLKKSRKRKSSNEPDGGPTTSTGRTLKQYSVEEKLNIIEYAKTSGNRAAGRVYNVAESSIREWRKNEQKLNNIRINSSGLSFNNNNNNNIKSQGERLQAEKYAAQLKFFQVGYPTMLPFFTSHFKPVVLPQSADSVGTPSSTSSHSSASTPPPPVPSYSPPPSGSGRRKCRVPQKVLQEP